MRKIENLSLKKTINNLKNYYDFNEFANQVSHFLNIEFNDSNGIKLNPFVQKNQSLITKQMVDLAKNKSNKLIIFYLLFHQVSLFTEEEFLQVKSEDILDFWQVLLLP